MTKINLKIFINIFMLKSGVLQINTVKMPFINALI